jgi:hypothetical protein
MSTIKRDTFLQEKAESSLVTPHDWLQSAPEQTMVHYHQIRPNLRGGVNRGLRGINSHGDSSNLCGATHLQPIEGIGIVWMLPNPEPTV